MRSISNTKNTKYDTKNPEASGCSSWFLVSFVLLFTYNSHSQQTEKRYLSGTGNDNTVNWQFMCTGGANSGKWKTIPVPSCWELQGFGKYDYGFAKDSIRGKEKGLYKHTFNVPSSWKGKVIKIVFEGVMTDAEVKINGKPAGPVHQGAFYAFKYNISHLLKYGRENLLEVTVAKHSTNESVNAAERRADFWIFGGIFRPVWLEALPAEHIERVEISTSAHDYVSIRVFAKTEKVDTVSVQLYDLNGEKFGKSFRRMVFRPNNRTDPSIYNWTNPFISLLGYTPNAKIWSPEYPNLYVAEISLLEKEKVVHTIRQRFGYRTIKVVERDGIYINDRKVKFKGVNRHSFWPTSGRTTSKKISIDDVLMMKDMNMNAVRMSHYPPDDHFFDACDSLGLYVIDELAGWHGQYDTPTGLKLVKEMIDHDVNHPSIVMWANGNEGGHNFVFDHEFKQYDIQKRPVIHPWQLFGGIETQHYREYNYGIGNYDHGHDIVMPTEFLHGQFDGGHGAGLEDYWEMMWNNPLSAGGFLWDFADQGVVRKDKKDSLDTDKHRGADGIVGPYHEKEGSYYAIKEIWSPIKFEEKEITPDFNGQLLVENRYDYTDLSECSFTYTFIRYDEYATYDMDSVVAQVPGIKPGEKNIISAALPPAWRLYAFMYVTARDKNGKEIVTKSYPIVRPFDYPQQSNAPPPKNYMYDPTSFSEMDSLYILSANGIQASIHRKTGMLVEVRNKKGTIPFNNGPIIQEGVTNFRDLKAKRDFEGVTLYSQYHKSDSYNTLEWKLTSSGILILTLNYFPGAYHTSMAGANFFYPESNIAAVEYMGRGPYRVWKNRMKGTQLGIWRKQYNNTETGEYPWTYPEFKGYYANLYSCKFITKDSQSFRISTSTDDVFLRLFTPAWKTDQWHNYEPIFPSGDISFMQGIPGIGTKTQRNETTGPMGIKNIYYDYEKDPSRALKMVLYFDFFPEKE